MENLPTPFRAQPGERPREPYRVLHVDGDAAQAARYRAYLEQAGMAVATATDPLLVMDVLRQFAPDLILLDVHMPHCSGIELAAVIRQYGEFALIPILFLTTEWDMDKTLAALNLNTDDFLTKRVAPWRLVNTLQARIERARSARRGTAELRTALRELETLQFALDRHAIVSIADAAGNITYVNDKFCQVSGYRREELLGQNHRLVKSGRHPQAVYDEMWATVAGGRVWHGELQNRKKDGTPYWVETTIVPVLDDFGVPQRYVSIRTEITRLKQAEEELILAREEAERANRAKSEFLSSMSHELRTPMNVILGFAQLLEADTLTPLAPSQKEDVRQILKAGGHLLTLINEVLDLSRIESGKIDLSIESVCAAHVLRECLDLVEPLARQRGIRIVNDLGASFNVQADRTRLRQALINLLSNAVKYNRENGIIRCTAELTAEGLVRIGIGDTGVGLTAAQQQGLFQAFNRLGAENSAVEGTGIGLALTRDLVELMGGNVGVQSVVGEGSTFWVELHAGQEPVAQAAAAASKNGAAASPGAAQKTVLYVEDNPANLRLVAQ